MNFIETDALDGVHVIFNSPLIFHFEEKQIKRNLTVATGCSSIEICIEMQLKEIVATLKTVSGQLPPKENSGLGQGQG